MTTKNKKVATGVGLGLAAAAATAAGAFYAFGGKKGAKNRHKVVKWAGDLKKDVVKQAKKVKKLDEQAYHAIVDEVANAYHAIQDIDPDHVMAAAGELKDGFAHVRKELKRTTAKAIVGVKSEVKAVKKDVKSVAKSVAKSASTAKKVVVSAAKKAVKPVAKAPAKKVVAKKK